VIRARHAISSAPMRELASRLHPLPKTSIEASDLKYRDFLTVALKIRSEDLFPDNWIYIHDSKVKVGRIQNFRSWSPEMVPDESVACVGLEYFCFEGDDLWAASDEDLVALATREMEILGLARPDQVIGGVVVRQEKAYPVYDDAYAANVAAMRAELESTHPTLHMVGRNGMHRYNNQDHAMMTAMLTVENIVAQARVYDIWCVNEDAEYHEAGSEGDAAGLPKPARPISRPLMEHRAPIRLRPLPRCARCQHRSSRPRPPDRPSPSLARHGKDLNDRDGHPPSAPTGAAPERPDTDPLHAGQRGRAGRGHGQFPAAAGAGRACGERLGARLWAGHRGALAAVEPPCLPPGSGPCGRGPAAPAGPVSGYGPLRPRAHHVRRGRACPDRP
jgi:hypothetical protein